MHSISVIERDAAGLAGHPIDGISIERLLEPVEQICRTMIGTEDFGDCIKIVLIVRSTCGRCCINGHRPLRIEASNAAGDGGATISVDIAANGLVTLHRLGMKPGGSWMFSAISARIASSGSAKGSLDQRSGWDGLEFTVELLERECGSS
ncbi:MAG: hypothetical protein AcusKO_43080 [Acuticoccus sp.]